MEEFMKIDREAVRQLRDDRSWSQEHLAAAASLSVRTIQRVESEGAASAETRLAIAAAFGVSPASLLPRSHPPLADPTPGAGPSAAPETDPVAGASRTHRRRLLLNSLLWATAIVAAAAMGGSALLCTVWLPAIAFASMLVSSPAPAGQCWSKFRITRAPGGS
jgi:transcriptional regulator with XRE-family HTH domain